MSETRRALQESRYWRSLRELHDGNAVSEGKAHEFMAGVTEDFQLSELSAMSRKQFLGLLAASAAFAAAGCSNYRDKGVIVPYTRQPEGAIPGTATFYASTCSGCEQACGILVKTREGRPIKIDGNPDHPVNKGKICATGQASILQLYDPHRLRRPVYGSRSGRKGELTWEAAEREILDQLERCTVERKEVVLFSGAVVSPTLAALLRAFQQRFPTSRIYSYGIFNDENRRRAWRECYGSGEPALVAWERARVIVALESDFLGTEGNVVEQTRAFASRRDVRAADAFNRLYAVEGNLSLTGANADIRLRLRPDFQLEFVQCLLQEIAVRRGIGRLDRRVADLVRPRNLAEFVKRHGLPERSMASLVDDLVRHRGQAIVHAGNGMETSVHSAVNLLNDVLGNNLLYRPDSAPVRQWPSAAADDLRSLIDRMQRGAVGMVVHLDANPVFHLPAHLGYAEALKSVPVRVSLAESEDETSEFCTHVLPIHNQLEAWGDAQTRSGVMSLQQPVIAPLFATRQKEGILLSWIRGTGTYTESLYHDYLKSRWEREVYPRMRRRADAASFWHASLHDGIVVSEEPVPARPVFRPEAVLQEVAAPPTELAVALTPNHFIGDGRFANNGWLQELPHPVSKIVWDNYAAVSPRTARDLDLSSNDLVEIAAADGSATVPVFVQPGLADGFVAVALGYGRTTAGPVGSGVGADVQGLLSLGNLTGSRILTNVRLRTTGRRHELVSTQEHHALDDTFLNDLHRKRKIIREGTLVQYLEDPKFLKHDAHEWESISEEFRFTGVKWAMAIDLNKCTGCSACVSACNTENNIPVVGREQVQKGREMQWMRIDRYYSGTPEAPVVSHQPMLCQHCDHAPCEKVCPVVATTHSPDGLNQMTYNRCVGTKYCSNNCPYKVRRFNFFDFRDEFADGYYEQEPLSLLPNPEVTVRSRGVMEKCTFCVQRIADARQKATEQGREVRGSDVTTACQVACPAEAIIFGDMNDPASDVSRYRAHDLGYHVLEELNVKPNVTYVARLRNAETEDRT